MPLSLSSPSSRPYDQTNSFLNSIEKVKPGSLLLLMYMFSESNGKTFVIITHMIVIITHIFHVKAKSFCTSNNLYRLCNCLIFYHYYQLFHLLQSCKNVLYQAIILYQIFKNCPCTHNDKHLFVLRALNF